MHVVLSTSLSRLLTLRIGVERFQYIGLKQNYFAKVKLSHSMCGPQ